MSQLEIIIGIMIITLSQHVPQTFVVLGGKDWSYRVTETEQKEAERPLSHTFLWGSVAEG